MAASRFGESLHQRAFGFMDLRHTTPISTNARFRVASVTKPITAAVVLSMSRDRQLPTNALVLKVLASPAWPSPTDRRWEKITIAHLLAHEGGWDREAAGDPMFMTREAGKALGRTPSSPDDMVRWMLGRPLQFDPGAKSAYANFGYCVLGRAVETVTHKPYIHAVQTRIASPLGIRSWALARGPGVAPIPDEVAYDFSDEGEHFRIELMDAHGGIVSTAADLCRFMNEYWLDGRKRPSGRKGQFFFFGSLPGTTAITSQRPDGINYAVLLNKRGHADEKWHEELQQQLDKVLDEPGS